MNQAEHCQTCQTCRTWDFLSALVIIFQARTPASTTTTWPTPRSACRLLRRIRRPPRLPLRLRRRRRRPRSTPRRPGCLSRFTRRRCRRRRRGRTATSLLGAFGCLIFALPNQEAVPEGCSIKRVFVLDLVKVFVLDLNILDKINEDFI